MIDAGQIIELLPRQRWFGAKGRQVAKATVLDEAILTDGSPALVFAIVSIEFSDGGTHLYNLPLLVEADGGCRDAFEDVERLRVLGELMIHGDTIKGSAGMFHFGGPGLDPRSPPGESSVRALAAEQSNSSLVFDEAVILKLFRRVESGPNPELELNRLLTNQGFESIPAHVGEILYEGETDEEQIEIDLGIAQQLIKDAREGWQETLVHLRALYDSAGEVDDVSDAVAQRASKNLDDMGKLGDVTATLHVFLAREELDPDVASEASDEGDLKQWVAAARASLERSLASGLTQLEPHRGAIEQRLDQVLSVADAGRKIRIHGDYHLGQVLLAARGWMILDFEGEPMRPLEERRTKQSPLKDVAGMLRSLSYAASAALFERAEPNSDEWRKLEPWAHAWERLARDAFWSGYLRTSHEGRFLPAERSTLALLLDLFEIDKALYELDYERGHRPDWIRIPLHGIEGVLQRDARR
ncbi:hypothetical protein BH24ACT26_BH24ACT26_01510 [soil metagenome]